MNENIRTILLLLFLGAAVVGITSTALMNSDGTTHEISTPEPQEEIK